MSKKPQPDRINKLQLFKTKNEQPCTLNPVKTELEYQKEARV